MNWATAIPLVSVLAVTFMAGGVYMLVRLMRSDLSELKKDMKESAKAQGERIGHTEDRVAVLEDFKARVEGREEARREFSEGIVQR